MITPRPKHLLIDLDGTLLVNREVPLAVSFVLNAVSELRKQNRRWGRYRALRALRATTSALEARAKAAHARHLKTNATRMREAAARELGISPEKAGEVLNIALQAVFPKLERHFYPTPGAREFVEWAATVFGPQGLTLATNPAWSEEIVRLRLRWAGVKPEYFGAITHAELMHACKPSAEYYEEVLRMRGLRAADCLLIGDEMKMDLPATRVGIRVFIVTDKRAEKRSAKKTAQRPQVEPLPPRKGRAQAWVGNYAALKKMLGD